VGGGAQRPGRRPAGRPPRVAPGDRHDIFYFGHKNHTFGHTQFSTRFFSLKTADSEKVVLEYCIIDFNEKQV
jgi:hypothetical protein